MADGSVGGFTRDKFAGVRAAFEGNLASGADLGACFTATVEGETVVDLWGGWADEARTRPWEKDTIVNVYSTTKTMTALTALLIADRGELDFDAPVAKYWPEFAANGKSQVKVSHLMSHSAGLSGWKEKVTLEDVYDWDKVTALLAAQAPYWEPGTASGYHAITQGFLVGEVVRRTHLPVMPRWQRRPTSSSKERRRILPRRSTSASSMSSRRRVFAKPEIEVSGVRKRNDTVETKSALS